VYPYVWLNGRITLHEDASISPLSPGLLYGQGAFETVRWTPGQGAFGADRHAARLQRALEFLGISAALPLPAFESAMREAVDANAPEGDVAVRLTVAEGESASAPTVLVLLRDISYTWEMYERGVSATLLEGGGGPLSRHKSLNYAAHWRARRIAVQGGYTEALTYDAQGRVLEGATSNLFLVSQGKVMTPPLELPLLPGITRATVLDLAAAATVPAEERMLSRADLRGADEAFLTNAVAGVLPLTSVDGDSVGDGAVGPVTSSLMTAYRSAVADELGAKA
jgi:branched-chain amino acid aminotransferase